MNKLPIFLFLIFSTGCCNQPELLKNGLTKKASQTIEYTIKVEMDSLNNTLQDTLVKIVNNFNENDQIISSIQQNLFNNSGKQIEFIYNENKKIKNEIVQQLNDSLKTIVDYIYKDTLLYKSQSETQNEIYWIKQINEYEYNADNTLKLSTLSLQYFDIETNDTITNTLEIKKYNEEELVTESELIDLLEPENNSKLKYYYDCGILMEVNEFNLADSLISKTKIKYQFDEYQNWIEIKYLENNESNYITTRKIKYK